MEGNKKNITNIKTQHPWFKFQLETVWNMFLIFKEEKKIYNFMGKLSEMSNYFPEKKNKKSISKCSLLKFFTLHTKS